MTHKKLWFRRWARTVGSRPAGVWNRKVLLWNEAGLVLLDAASGIEERQLELPGGWALIAGDVLLGWFRDYVYAVDLRSGALLWRFDTDGSENPISCEPCASDEVVFFGLADGTVIALGLRDGREIWRRKVVAKAGWQPGEHEAVRGAACLLDGTVIFRVVREVAAAIGVSPQTGETVWTFLTGVGDGISDAALYGGRYHIIGTSGMYAVLDAATGKPLLKTDLKQTIPPKLFKTRAYMGFYPLLVSETHAWVGVGPGYVMAFKRETGEYAWHHLPKSAGAFQAQTYFTSFNGRLYYADMSARMYWLEEENATDPVLLAQRQGKAQGPKRRAAREQETEEEPRLGFAIEGIERKGGWRRLRCVSGEARFVLEVSLEDMEPPAWGEGRLSVPTPGDGERLLQAMKKALGPARGKPIAWPEKPPRALRIALLGAGRDESGGGEGTWAFTKWTAGEGVPEFFVNWSELERRGAILEKEEGYRLDLYSFFAALGAVVG